MVGKVNSVRFGVFGAGGVGGYFGGRLAQAGRDVTFIARGNHLAAIQENGLNVPGDCELISYGDKDINRIIVPRRNEPDLDDLPKEVRDATLAVRAGEAEVLGIDRAEAARALAPPRP